MKKSTYFLIIAANLFLVGCSKNNLTEDTSKSNSSEQTLESKATEKDSATTSNTEKKYETQSNSNNNQVAETEKSSAITTATTPETIRGTWSGTAEDGTVHRVTIGMNSLLFGETNYKITHFDQAGDTYTLYWDENDFKKNYHANYSFNPQPFIYSYDSATNRLALGFPSTSDINVEELIYLNKE